MYKPLRAYIIAFALKASAQGLTPTWLQKETKTLGLVVTYFFFGSATLANLVPRLPASKLVPLGETTIPRDG